MAMGHSASVKVTLIMWSNTSETSRSITNTFHSKMNSVDYAKFSISIWMNGMHGINSPEGAK